MNHQITGDRDTHLSPTDLSALEADLREQRLFREEQLRQIAMTSLAGGPRRSAAHDEVHAQLAVSARMVLADVKAALRRMSEGRYGRCRLCRRLIDREHLMIVPQAPHCSRCRQVREAGR